MKHILLELISENQNNHSATKKWNAIKRKANFQMQDLMGWMFTPCTPDGNPIERPHDYEDNAVYIAIGTSYYNYQRAQSRVLFKGFNLVTNIDEYYTAETEERMFTFVKGSGKYHGEAKIVTICEMGFELTEAGLKLYG